MIFYKKFNFHFQRLKNSCLGAFAVMLALMLPGLLLLGGIFIDIARWMHYRSSLTQVIEASILSTSVVLANSVSKARDKHGFKLSEYKLKENLLANFKENIKNIFAEADCEQLINNRKMSVTLNGNNSVNTISLASSYDLKPNPLIFILGMMNIKSYPVHAISKGEVNLQDESVMENDIYIQWVIDSSGSMDHNYLKYDEIGGFYHMNCLSKRLHSNILPSPKDYNSRIAVVDSRNVVDSINGEIYKHALSCNQYLYNFFYPPELYPSYAEKKALFDIQDYFIIKKYVVRDAMAVLMSAIRKMKNFRDRVWMSAIFFSDKIDINTGFQSSMEHVKSAVRHNDMSDKGSSTDIYKAILEADKQMNSLQGNNLDRYLIFLTDGADMLGNHAPIIQRCNEIKKRGVIIITLAFSVSLQEREKSFALLSSCATPGYFFKPDDSEALNKIFRDKILNAIFKRVIKITK
ncbi:VWA domain-containing protein [Candidatus Liberibacter africanus]|uniref:VWFA domain-containing protein n=1 Tax=Candidatus Liberibacter africanus PTSAPSY TaxID=1277257 RepID=A0A0G3I8A6_LIBAF|nr:vWA domain-containing protein [Candidatus Liberibacter africanus]AKK19942.1 hypothetical protein G293_01550 [Candidatus Liberibacter africanus PTSAPSY]QTP63783.1 VWA domain-containing protein [Candidatus Liberibacter africanus]